MTEIKLKKNGTIFTNKELDFINEVAEYAFIKNSRPLVLVAICDAIIENVAYQSEGKLNKKTLLKLMGMSDGNLDVDKK